MNIGAMAMALGFLLIMIGLWGILTKRNLIHIIIGFSILDTGSHVVIVASGYLQGRSAPIIGEMVTMAEASQLVVDPLPQALVLTAIVIGLGVTALMLAFALKLHDQNNTLDIKKLERLKW